MNDIVAGISDCLKNIYFWNTVLRLTTEELAILLPVRIHHSDKLMSYVRERLKDFSKENFCFPIRDTRVVQNIFNFISIL